MSKQNPIDASMPKTCPDCQATVKTSGKITEQKKAVMVKFIAGITLVALTLLGMVVLWFVVGRISIRLMLLVVFLAMIPSAGIFEFGNSFPKIKELRCSKCRWMEYYLFTAKKLATTPRAPSNRPSRRTWFLIKYCILISCILTLAKYAWVLRDS